ncbi:MAG: hypothetical protein Q9222_005271 [Ikaeria aurantiellina]
MATNRGSVDEGGTSGGTQPKVLPIIIPVHLPLFSESKSAHVLLVSFCMLMERDSTSSQKSPLVFAGAGHWRINRLRFFNVEQTICTGDPHAVCYNTYGSQRPTLSMDLASAPHRPLRMPSPTLTDPDMILPDSHNEHHSSSPQKRDPSFSQSQWNNLATTDDGQMKSAVRNLFGNGQRLRHKGSEGALRNQDAADRRPQSKQSELSQRTGNSAIASSPLLHEGFGNNTTSSAVTSNAPSDSFDTLDDGSVISESVSPLVEAERNGYMMSESGGINGYKFSDRFRKAIVEEDDGGYSHAAMSVRAEEILANAKKRLTEMESNLNRARHTINRPASSMSSFNNQNADPQSLYTLPKTLSPSKHRQQQSPPSSSSSKGHSRVFSETSVPSSMQTSPRNEDGSTEVPRSLSAMGGAGPDTPQDPSTKQGPESRDWFWAGLTRNASHGARYVNHGLQPLNEDGPPPSTFDSPERQQSPPNVDRSPGRTPTGSLDLGIPTQELGSESSPGLTRARSTTQMRDIRDQMKDLKGKISSLKQRAREDSLRRRSLQSLRTPSPFTAAEQWYTGAPRYDNTKSKPRETSPRAVQPVIEENEVKHYPVQESTATDTKGPERAMDSSSEDKGISSEEFQSDHSVPTLENNSSPQTVVEGIHTTKDDPPDEPLLEEVKPPEAVDDSKEISTMGVEVYPEPAAMPIGGRHEDRPDAFDYEHLFLHSGMGTLGQGGKSRSSSHSSTYSVETTKPSNTMAESREVLDHGNKSMGDSSFGEEQSPDSHHGAHIRKGSVESVSTVATFATATEGDKNSESSDIDDEDEWVYSRPMAGSWEPEYPSNRKATIGRKDGPQPGMRLAKAAVQTTNPSLPTEDAANIVQSSTLEDVQLPELAKADLLTFLTSKLPSNQDAASQSIELSESDQDLAEKLIRSVANVCSQLQAFTMEGHKYGGRQWRRRLDGARRVLDGETNGEVF